jgi:hypothetical protein
MTQITSFGFMKRNRVKISHVFEEHIIINYKWGINDNQLHTNAATATLDNPRYFAGILDRIGLGVLPSFLGLRGSAANPDYRFFPPRIR